MKKSIATILTKRVCRSSDHTLFTAAGNADCKAIFHHLSRIIQNRIEQNRRGRKVKTDRKTRQKIDDKKFGLGLH
ncbi:MAG: hypothetical protein IJG99_08425 [Ruminococcus sp.]|nr:hypothetical protein [Ruminococcus sp.]